MAKKDLDGFFSGMEFDSIFRNARRPALDEYFLTQDAEHDGAKRLAELRRPPRRLSAFPASPPYDVQGALNTLWTTLPATSTTATSSQGMAQVEEPLTRFRQV